VGEKVDLTWEKCERKYVVLEQNDMLLAEKVALLEEYLPSSSARRGIAQHRIESKTPSKILSNKKKMHAKTKLTLKSPVKKTKNT
jgi:hypothetical protein